MVIDRLCIYGQELNLHKAAIAIISQLTHETV
jgi:hypothetical protein